MKGVTSLTRLLGVAVVVGGIGSVASAATVINDNFEGYTSQANFQATWAPIGSVAPLSAEWSTAQSASPTHSVRTPGTATNSQSRNRRTFAETDTVAPFGTLSPGESIVWSFDFYDSAPTGAPQRNYSNLQDSTAPASSNQLISMGLNNNQSATNSGGQYYMARILGYTVPTTADPDGGATESVGGSGAYFKLNDFTSPHRSLGWHNLKVVISSDNPAQGHDYEFYVDGVLSERVVNVGTVVRSYDNITLGSGLSNGSVEAFFDNVSLEVVPEPSSLAVLGLGAVALGVRRRRAN